ncbi:PREDICTED: N-acetyltransferase 8 isoform X1 [Rhinopithecus bieti]|uniref:N-acetyltransferase 8 isoform X1 n=2 Tax=Rhinopithecus bieti TaxID=61621 RepID=UPI00083BF8D0|nr:PREDICTED: N-acetyltransferase 8 isoform X1 [Rhinopithecus bieti]
MVPGEGPKLWTCDLPEAWHEGVQGSLALTPGLRDFRHRSLSMAPYHIRKYQENDRKWVVGLLSQGMAEHIPATFWQLLKLPRTLILLLGGPLALLLVSGSWLLALMFSLSLLPALWFLAKKPWKEYVDTVLRTDMSDITKSYLSERDSCFWVAESEEKVVGMVGALPVDDPTLKEKRLQLFHLSVDSEHRGQGIAKALVRTVLQFARDQNCSEVVLDTSNIQLTALSLYQSMGFQKTGQSFFCVWARLVALTTIHFIYCLPSSQAGGL